MHCIPYITRYLLCKASDLSNKCSYSYKFIMQENDEEEVEKK